MFITFTIKAVPQSGKQALVWNEKNNQLKCFLKSAPERNKANEELCKFLRKMLGTDAGSIVIIAGQSSRRKIVKVTTHLSREALLSHAGLLM